MAENIILADKSMAFSIRMVHCYEYLKEEKREFIMSKQLFRSATSVGANIHEGLQAQSKPDFISKLSISLNEASEASYWLTLLHKTAYFDDDLYNSLKGDIDEIIRLLIASIKTSKKNLT